MRPAALAILLTLLAWPVALAKPPDLGDPDKIVSEMAYGAAGHMGREWWEARKQAVRRDPATFAPFIRERLMRLPATLDEYSVDDPQWVINRPSPGHPGSLVTPLMRILTLLPPDHAEPIIREYFLAVTPLAVEARRRYWRAQDAARAEGQNATVGTSEAWLLMNHLGTAMSAATGVAKDMRSTVLVDDLLVMMSRDDPAERIDAALRAWSYFPEIAEKRPDAIVRARAIAEELAFSDDARVAEAGRTLHDRLRTVAPAEEAPPRDNTPADPARQREP